MSNFFGNRPEVSRPVEALATASASPPSAVPVLYPATQPSHTLELGAAGPATLFVSGDPGTFTVTGSDSGIIVHRELAGATGTYTLTGNAGVTHLTHFVAGATGVFTETGSAAGIIVHRELAGATGTFTETGNAAGIIVHRELAGATGVFSETGNVAGIILRRKLSAATGVFAETGNAGLFRLTLGSAQLFLAGDTGVFALTGNDGLFQLVARPEAQGGVSGYLRREKGYSRLGGNVMVQTMGEATERAEKIMVGWRDDEEALLVIQIIESFYD